MPLRPTHYFYSVELIALEEYLSHSMDRVALLKEKATKGNDSQAADKISRLQTAIGTLQRYISRMK